MKYLSKLYRNLATALVAAPLVACALVDDVGSEFSVELQILSAQKQADAIEVRYSITNSGEEEFCLGGEMSGVDWKPGRLVILDDEKRPIRSSFAGGYIPAEQTYLFQVFDPGQTLEGTLRMEKLELLDGVPRYGYLKRVIGLCDLVQSGSATGQRQARAFYAGAVGIESDIFVLN